MTYHNLQAHMLASMRLLLLAICLPSFAVKSDLRFGHLTLGWDSLQD